MSTNNMTSRNHQIATWRLGNEIGFLTIQVVVTMGVRKRYWTDNQ
jgi:hypothetical protein